MSQPIDAVVSVTENIVVVKKERKPSLPAKYAKFQQFGFAFVSLLHREQAIDEDLLNAIVDKLLIFDEVPAQAEFFAAILDKDAMKESNKALRKTVSLHKKELLKASMPPKQSRRAKKEVDPDAPPKVGRKKKTEKAADNLVDELVRLSSGEPTVPPDAPSLEEGVKGDVKEGVKGDVKEDVKEGKKVVKKVEKKVEEVEVKEKSVKEEEKAAAKALKEEEKAAAKALKEKEKAAAKALKEEEKAAAKALKEKEKADKKAKTSTVVVEPPSTKEEEEGDDGDA